MDTGDGASVHAVGNALASFCDDRVWQRVSLLELLTLLYHFSRRLGSRLDRTIAAVTAEPRYNGIRS